MNIWWFMDRHPFITIILAVLIITAAPHLNFSWKRVTPLPSKTKEPNESGPDNV